MHSARVTYCVVQLCDRLAIFAKCRGWPTSERSIDHYFGHVGRAACTLSFSFDHEAQDIQQITRNDGLIGHFNPVKMLLASVSLLGKKETAYALVTTIL